jgi:predicted acetyltransferase
MQIALIPAFAPDKPLFATLMQLYLYDLSEFSGADLDEQGCFSDPWLDSDWSKADCHPFLIHVEGRLAGFALVNRYSRLHNPFDGHAVAEFFVMRRYRRRGVGRTAAMQLFDRFPGRWEVASFALNVPGHVFWRGVIDRYTGGRYSETWFQMDGWRGPVQSFVAPAAARRE